MSREWNEQKMELEENRVGRKWSEQKLERAENCRMRRFDFFDGLKKILMHSIA